MFSSFHYVSPIFALALCAAGAVFPAATARAQPVPVPGLYCDEEKEFYGREGYTYTKVQACLLVEERSARAVLSTSETQYWQSGFWYYAGGGTTATWDASGNVTPEGASPVVWDIREVIQDRAVATGESASITPFCGRATMAYKFHMDGPRWYDEAYEIDPRPRSFNLNVPCLPTGSAAGRK